MNLNEIRALVSIAELGGVTRAASRLNRSQPAVSRRIRLLEQELGAPLIEAVRGGVTLTEAGRAFLPHAQTALAAIRDGTEAVRGIRQEERGTVSLGWSVRSRARPWSTTCGGSPGNTSRCAWSSVPPIAKR